MLKVDKELSMSSQVDIFIEMMAAERGASRNTLAAYLRDLKDFEIFMLRRSRNIESADSKNIQDYFAQLKIKGRKPATHARKLSVLKGFYQFLYAERQRDEDPSDKIDGPRMGRSLPKYLSVNEVELLLEAAREQSGNSGVRLVALLEVIYATGLRVSEPVSYTHLTLPTKA